MMEALAEDFDKRESAFWDEDEDDDGGASGGRMGESVA
jgi:hypothetical protein